MKPHLSPTQLDMYCRCPEAYRRRYVENEIIPPGVAMMQGTAVHKAASENFTQKVESRTDMRPAEFRELAAASFEAAVAGGYVLTDEEASRGAGIVLGEAKDNSVAMAEFHGAKQAPDYQPAAGMVEAKVRIPLPMASHDLLGIIDLADDRDRIVDFKTAGRRKSQADADGSVQLSTYAAAFQAQTGRPPAEVRLDVVVKTKTKIDRQVLSSPRDKRDLTALANRINAVSAAIKAGTFTPAAPGSWNCSPKWCGFWATCPFINSERRAAAEGSEQ